MKNVRPHFIVRVAHTIQNTHKDTHTEAVSGTTEVLWVAVSQTLFLDECINSQPSLPRHRHAAHSPACDSHIDLTCSFSIFVKMSCNISLSLNSFSHHLTHFYLPFLPTCLFFSPWRNSHSSRYKTTPSTFVLINEVHSHVTNVNSQLGQ